MRVRLTKKLAAILDGVDVSMLSVGDILELPDSSAALLISEKWAVAEKETPGHLPNPSSKSNPTCNASD